MSKRHLTPIQTLCKEMIMHGTHAYATSLDVAEHFKKEHRNVMRDLKNMDCSNHFSTLNFERSNYVGDNGKTYDMVEMTRDGFAMLVMGFTGKDAARWKEAYINAFNRMERHIRAENRHNDNVWREANAERLNAERGKAASIHEFIKYAIHQGSRHSGWYFANFAKMINAIAVPDNPFAGPLLWSAEQNARVSAANVICEIAIHEGIRDAVPYREIYYTAKDSLQAHAISMGWPVAILTHDNPPEDVPKTETHEKQTEAA